jgi:hypothetical protein
MRIRFPILLAIVILLLLPLAAAAEPSAPEGVSNFSVSPDPVNEPTGAGTKTLTISYSVQINSADSTTGFCIYGPQTGYTYPNTVTLNKTVGFTVTPLTFTKTDTGVTCPSTYGTGVYYSINNAAVTGNFNYSGSFNVTISAAATPATTTWYFLLQDPAGSPNPASDTHTLAGPLAVRLASFSAAPAGSQVKVQWASASEVDNVGFNVYRSTSAEAPSQQMNSALIASQASGSSESFAYEWVDGSVQAGVTYYYWLEDVDANGDRTMSGPVSAAPEAPTAVELNTLSAMGTPNAGMLPLLSLGLLGTAAVAMVWRRRR